jgi:triosephosphate isomerase
MIQAAHLHCRKVLQELFGKKVADEVSILYGGSVKVNNVKEIMKCQDVDGTLVGGASLDPKSFAEIAENCHQLREEP